MFDLLLLFLCGGLLISLGDRVHLAFDVLVQTDDSILGQAWWVMPNFGVLSLVLYWGYARLRRSLGELPRETSAARIAFACAAFFAAYASTGPLADWGPWLGLLLTLLWIPRVLLLRSRAALIFSLLLAVLGPLGEAAIAATGRFHYLTPDLYAVPSWLGAVYLHGALVLPELESLLSSRAEARAARGAQAAGS